MGAHTGRCFRATRRTKLRKAKKGELYPAVPIRYKVPTAIRAFLAQVTGGQRRAVFSRMADAILRYNDHQIKVGGALARAEGQAAEA